MVGLYGPLQDKVRGKFPSTFEEALDFAHMKSKKLCFQQLSLAKGEATPIVLVVAPLMVQPLNTQLLPMVHAQRATTTPKDLHLELLQKVTEQLSNLSLNLIQGVRTQGNNEGNQQRAQREPYVCYNCGWLNKTWYVLLSIPKENSRQEKKETPSDSSKGKKSSPTTSSSCSTATSSNSMSTSTATTKHHSTSPITDQ